MVSDHGPGRGPDHGVGVDPETVNCGTHQKKLQSVAHHGWVES